MFIFTFLLANVVVCFFFFPVAKSILQASICSQLPVGHVFTMIVLAGLLSDIQIPLD